MTDYRLMNGALVALMFCFFASEAIAKVFQFKSTDEYVVDKDFELAIAGTSGSIHVLHRAGDKVTVETTKEIDASSRAQAEKLEDQLEVAVRADRKSLSIQTRYPLDESSDGFWSKLFDLHRGRSASVHFVIAVPTSVHLTISSTSGDIHLEELSGIAAIAATSGNIEIADFTGNCSLRTTSGDIKLKDIKGDLEINSTSSDVLFDDISGNVNLRSTSGDTEGYWISGRTRITKTSGDVRMESCSGEVDIITTSGNIDVKQREGGLSVSTASGDVHVRSDLVKGERYEIETISGNIVFEVPTEMKGDVRLATVSGSINTNLAIEVQQYNRYKLDGRVRSEGPELHLNTTSGDISLQGF